MTRHLHIVCLDVPWPADYGGAIDMFYKIKTLWQAGVKIHLHYFCYNERGNPNELNKYCESIHTYKRKTGLKSFSLKLPYIVASRINNDLIENLGKDSYPILLEGTHCTGILNSAAFADADRKIVVRIHNDESEYYKNLASSTTNISKKIYFLNESRLLNKYEHNLPQSPAYACITDNDVNHFKNEHGLKNVFFLPAFSPFNEVESNEGVGNFCLYHGNLSVPENERAAVWLLTKVFAKLKIPFVIAGKKPSRRLDKLAHLCQHTCLVANPSVTEINDLVRKAQINILPSFSTTGIKMKLIHALFEGRHCLVNEKMVAGTGLEEACHIGSNARAFASIIMQLYHQPFTEEETRLRKLLLEEKYNNEKNAASLIAYLW